MNFDDLFFDERRNVVRRVIVVCRTDLNGEKRGMTVFIGKMFFDERLKCLRATVKMHIAHSFKEMMC